MSNLDLWEWHADIDPKFTKPITGKQYKGTSPNPQYVIRCLTEMFGPVGQGFGWEIVREEFTPLGEEVLHWCRIRFWHGRREDWFESYGQTKALLKTKNGLMADEDAPKKSLTDAIVKAASHIGVAANIFLGRWDDQKYVQSVADSFREEPEQPATLPKKDARDLYSALEADMRRCDTREELIAWWQDSECREKRMTLPHDWQKNLRAEWEAQGKALAEAHARDKKMMESV
jgi:hypothetical protein